MPMSTDYNGHTVTVDEKYFNFHVTGPLFTASHENAYSSLAQAREAIDKRTAQQASQERERVHMPVVTDSGKLAVITGVHARNDVLLGIDDSVNTVYPREAFITGAMAELAALHTRKSELDKLLYQFAIRRHSGGYSNGWTGRDHADKVASLKHRYDHVTSQARAHQASLSDPEVMLANVIKLADNT